MSNNVLTNTPGFVNPSAGDFRVSPGSVAIDAGASVLIFNDKDGNARPQGGVFDIGAYEYASGIITPPACTPNWSCTAWSACSQAASQIRTCADINNCGSNANKPIESQICTPPDITTPNIANVQSASITINSAGIMWTTNENATTQVEYGLTTSYGQNSTLVTTLSASHSMLISGLNPSTTYHYRVRSSDAAGNTSISQDYTFSTLSLPDTTAPNQITQVSVSQIGQSSARIAWPSASDNIGIIGYDLRWSTSLITQGNFFSATRVQALLIVPVSGTIQQYYISTGLTPATTYYFSVVAYDAAGNVSVISNVGTVTTQSAPTTQNPTPSTDPGTVSVPNTASGGGGGGGGGAGYTVYQLTDTIPPSPPGTAVGTALDGQALLQWPNPTDSGFVPAGGRGSSVGWWA